MTDEDVKWLLKKLEPVFSKEEWARLEQICQAPDFLENLQFIAEQRS
jgi:hypothetical protein